MSTSAEALQEKDEDIDNTSSEDENTPLLDVSDEEFENMSLEQISALSSKDKQEGDSDEEDVDQDIEEDEEDEEEDSEETEDDNDDDDSDEEFDDSDEDTEEGDNEEESTSDKAKQPFDDSKETKSEEKESKKKEKDDSEDSVDYKAEYQKLLAPFRANNRDMQVDSVEDARVLMQMGANYNKKMAALKPNLKLIKMLDNHDLLDEEKLSFLIDLDKKNPEAVAKFIKDSGVDPLEIDTDKASNYKANTYTVNDKEVELDGILEELKDTKSFNETIDIIGNKWDEQSKQVLLDNPSIIRIINDHVSSGIYSKINQVVEQERMMGRLQGLSDIEAYKEVGDAINAAGGFDTSSPQQSSNIPTNSVSTKQKSNKVADPEIRSRKKAAGLTKTTSRKKVKEDFNPLALSDEEFEKIANSKYI